MHPRHPQIKCIVHEEICEAGTDDTAVRIGWEHIAFSGDFLWQQAAKSSSRKTLVLPDGAQTA